jgi:hypothetical protein
MRGAVLITLDVDLVLAAGEGLVITWLTDLGEKRRHCRVHEHGMVSRSSERLTIEGVAGAGLEHRAEVVLRNPERLEIDIGKDAVEELRGRHVVPVPWAAVIGPREDGVIARLLGVDQPEVLVGPFGGAPLNQPLAARRNVTGGTRPSPTS